MPETVRVNENEQIIEVHSHDQVTDKDLLQTLQQIERLMTRTGITAVLIDTLEQTSAPGTFALHTVTGRLPSKARFAILSSPDHPARPKQQLTENVADGQGLAVRVFSDRDLALRWLRGNGPQRP